MKEISSKKILNKKLLLAIIIVCIIALVLIFKDSILYTVDFYVRKSILLNEYKNREIITAVDEEGYTYNNYVGMKIENAKIKDGNLTFDIAIKMSDSYKDKELFLSHGLFIFDNNKNFIVAKDNYLFPLFSRLNDTNIIKHNDNGSKLNIPVYSLGICKELNINKKKLFADLDNVNLLLTPFKLEGNYGRITYSFKLPDNFNPTNTLNIRINEPLIFDYKTYPFPNNSHVYLEDNFTEWQFKVNVEK